MDIKELPTTVTAEIHIQLEPGGGRVVALTHDMSEYGYLPIGKHSVEVPVPQDISPVEIELDMLNAKEHDLKARFEEQLVNIKGRRAELLALTWQPDEQKDEQV